MILVSFFFFFNDTATTEIYTLSLHDALPILPRLLAHRPTVAMSLSCIACSCARVKKYEADRKSTRLNSSHGYISYAVFCLKKKKAQYRYTLRTVLHTDQRGLREEQRTVLRLL